MTELLSSVERAALQLELERQYRWCNFGSRAWSFVHHGTLAVTAICSASAALLVKLSTPPHDGHENWVAGLAGSAALLATLATAGGFERKWRTNRVNRGRVRWLLIAITADDANLEAIRSELHAVIASQDEGITGTQLGSAVPPLTAASRNEAPSHGSTPY